VSRDLAKNSFGHLSLILMVSARSKIPMFDTSLLAWYTFPGTGGMAEWTKATVLKTVVAE
jgi:hypothetical protein